MYVASPVRDMKLVQAESSNQSRKTLSLLPLYLQPDTPHILIFYTLHRRYDVVKQDAIENQQVEAYDTVQVCVFRLGFQLACKHHSRQL